MVARIVRTGTGRGSAPAGREVTAVLCPHRTCATEIEAHHTLRRADGARVGHARCMTESTAPQPRDIALEQETPEQAADLESQSEPDGDPLEGS